MVAIVVPVAVAAVAVAGAMVVPVVLGALDVVDVVVVWSRRLVCH